VRYIPDDMYGLCGLRRGLRAWATASPREARLSKKQLLRHDSRAVSEEIASGKREDFWNDLEAYQTSFAAKRPNVETNRSNAHTIKQRSYLAGRQGWQCYPGIGLDVAHPETPRAAQISLVD